MDTFTAHQLADHYDSNSDFELEVPDNATGVRWDNGWVECMNIVKANSATYGLDDYATSSFEFIFDRPGRCSLHRDIDNMDGDDPDYVRDECGLEA